MITHFVTLLQRYGIDIYNAVLLLLLVIFDGSLFITDVTLCRDCDIIHPESDNILKTRITVAPGCGEDVTCHPKLNLNAYFKR